VLNLRTACCWFYAEALTSLICPAAAAQSREGQGGRDETMLHSAGLPPFKKKNVSAIHLSFFNARSGNHNRMPEQDVRPTEELTMDTFVCCEEVILKRVPVTAACCAL